MQSVLVVMKNLCQVQLPNDERIENNINERICFDFTNKEKD